MSRYDILASRIGGILEMNRKLGLCASLVTLAAVAAFALSMLIGSTSLSYLSSIFIALGFVPMICAFSAACGKHRVGMATAAVVFAAVYAVLILLVYYAQLTTVRLSGLSPEAAAILDYRQFGLFFSYDLLGYAFMALSTFFIAFTVNVRSRADRALKTLFLIHGVFFIFCFIMPLLGVFSPGMAGGDLLGVLVLEFWCAYFIPVCILAFLHFKKARQN